MKYVCMFIGLLRSIARFSSDKSFPLISKIFPPPFRKKTENVEAKQFK